MTVNVSVHKTKGLLHGYKKLRLSYEENTPKQIADVTWENLTVSLFTPKPRWQQELNRVSHRNATWMIETNFISQKELFLFLTKSLFLVEKYGRFVMVEWRPLDNASYPNPFHNEFTSYTQFQQFIFYVIWGLTTKLGLFPACLKAKYSFGLCMFLEPSIVLTIYIYM